MTIKGKVALVTGAGQGIGRAIALRLARDGADIAVVDVNEAKMNDVAEEVRVIAVDLKGVFLCLRAQIQHMLSADGGAIVNTASIAGVIADPGMAPYVAAKHGVIGLTKSAAIDYAKHGIRVNALAPGLVHTPMTQRWLDDPVMREVVLAGPLMGRPAKPEEMAGMVLFLCSPLASYATGQTFIVDAGQTAH